jgi:exodeoxyribonuclease VII small subunit
MSYEVQLQRLGEIVGELESSTLQLDDALRLFEEGIALLRTASDDLTRAEGRVQQLVEQADGIFQMRGIDDR